MKADRNSTPRLFLRLKKIFAIIAPLLGISYPLLVYFELKLYLSAVIACLIGLSMICELFPHNGHAKRTRLLILVVVTSGICITGVLLNNSVLTLYLPFLMSITFLTLFSCSFLSPPYMIEVFARMLVPHLSIEEVIYCRNITLIWMCFFFLNGTLAFYTACCMSLGIWSIYNGLIAYAVMGLLFTMELSYRSWRFRHYAGLPTDFIFKKLFPPKT